MDRPGLLIFFCLSLLITFFPISLLAVKICTLPGVLQPGEIEVDETAIYISDQFKVSIYPVADYQLTKTIGKKGEGPGEFLYTPRIHISPGNIFLYTSRKFSSFTREGKLIEEKIFPFPAFDINPVGDNFVINRWTTDSNDVHKILSEIILTDHDLNRKKSIYKIKREINLQNILEKLPFVKPIFKFQTQAGKIFLADGNKGFFIKVYDNKGDTIAEINKEYERVRITAPDKKRIIEAFKEKPFIKKRWSFIEKQVKSFDGMFPEFFPAIDDFLVSGDKIYVITYKHRGEKVETVVLNMNGKVLQKLFLPRVDNRLYAICNNRFYYLKENEHTETWEIHVEYLTTTKPKKLD